MSPALFSEGVAGVWEGVHLETARLHTEQYAYRKFHHALSLVAMRVTMLISTLGPGHVCKPPFRSGVLDPVSRIPHCPSAYPQQDRK